jgi:hypothetical protein
MNIEEKNMRGALKIQRPALTVKLNAVCGLAQTALRSFKKLIYYVGYCRAVLNVGGSRGKAERGINYAPPIIARARAQLNYKRVVNSLFQRKVAVNAGRKIFRADLRPRRVVKSVFGKRFVAYFFNLAKQPAHYINRRLFVHATGNVGGNKFYHFVFYYIFNVLVNLRVGVGSNVYAQVVVFRPRGFAVKVDENKSSPQNYNNKCRRK